MTQRSNLACLLTAALVPTSLLAAAAEAAPVAPFLFEYRGDRAPEAADATDPATSPAWAAATVGTTTANSDFTATTGLDDSGYLRIESSRALRPRYTYAGSAWNISEAFTVELRAKVISVDPESNTDAAVEVIGGDTTGRFLFRLGEDGVLFRTQTVTPTSLPGFDPLVYNAYRILGEKVSGAWRYSVYVNDTLAIENEAQYSSTVNSLFFGDSSTAYGGESEIDYIRWNNTAAVAPIPEPASVALGALGGVLLLGRRKRGV